MKRLLLAAFVLVACSSPAAPTTLEACSWTPTTQTAFLPTFTCLDGKAAPSGLPSPAIINVWGSWCDPCREEIPYFVSLDEKYDVQIIGVDVDEPNISAGQNFALKSKMSWPNLFDTKGQSVSVFGPGVPVTWFIDASGEVVYKKIGVWKSYKELESTAKKYGLIK